MTESTMLNKFSHVSGKYPQLLYKDLYSAIQHGFFASVLLRRCTTGVMFVLKRRLIAKPL